MGIFYIDTEYTNGNYYLGDIFEIAVLSESSGFLFHSYVNTQQQLPRYVSNMCNVTNTFIKNSPTFNEVMNDLIQFIKQEELNKVEKSITVLIAHGGYLFDYPLLITNCMRRSDSTTIEHSNFVEAMKHYIFIDSIQVLQRLGYKRTSLDVLKDNSNNSRIHSAAKDVTILRDIVKKYNVLCNITLSLSNTLQDILCYIQTKLPISINELCKFADEALSREDLETILHTYVNKKTALNAKQLCTIANMYFVKQL